jgi:hypothetical protein
MITKTFVFICIAILAASFVVADAVIIGGGLGRRFPPGRIGLPITITDTTAQERIQSDLDAGYTFGHDDVVIMNPEKNGTICSVNIWKEGNVDIEITSTEFHDEPRTKTIIVYNLTGGILKSYNETIIYNVSIGESITYTENQFQHINIADPIFACSDDADTVIADAISKIEGDQTPVTDIARPAQPIEIRSGSGVILLPPGEIP